MNYVKLVDNLDEFNRYPWGNVAWNFLHEKITTFIEKSRPRDTNKVRLPGFFLPLQIWAFESFPILSEQKICHKVSDTVIPLMLQWKSTFKVSALKMREIDFSSSQVNLVTCPLINASPLFIYHVLEFMYQIVYTPLRSSTVAAKGRVVESREKKSMKSTVAAKEASKVPPRSTDKHSQVNITHLY